MDKLPHSVLLQILSRLNDSADVARCRVASKSFDTVFPGIRSINLQCSRKWYNRACSSQRIKPFKTVFLDLISKLEAVESVCIDFDWQICGESDDFSLTDEFFAEWLPRVSGSLKSLSLSHFDTQSGSNVLMLISAYCHNLVTLKLKFAWVYVRNLNPIPTLTSLTFSSIFVGQEHLTRLNKYFPNLQALKFNYIKGLEHLKIQLYNLKTCSVAVHDDNLRSLTIITPNLITLKIRSINLAALHVAAPMVSHLKLSVNGRERATALSIKKFENLKTVWLDSARFGNLLLKFPVTKTVENLTLYSEYGAPRESRDSEFSLRKVFTVFPNVSSLCIQSEPWSQLETYLHWYPKGWMILDGRKGLKTICAYLRLADPSLSFSFLACILDQCVGLLEVSLLMCIEDEVQCDVADSFWSKCVARWPGLKWKCGIRMLGMEDVWIPDSMMW